MKSLKTIVGLLIANSIILCCCLVVLVNQFYIKPAPQESEEVVLEEKSPNIALNELPIQYPLEQAKKDDCIVVVNHEITHGLENWFYFVIKSSIQVNDFVRIAIYDRENSQTPKIRDLYYKNGRYILEDKETGVNEYLYLKFQQISSTKEDGMEKFYFLTNQWENMGTEVLSYQAIHLYPDRTEENNVVVVKDGKITEGMDVWLTFIAQKAINEVKIQTSSDVITVGWDDSQMAYYFIQEDEVKEYLNYQQIFFDEKENTLHYVLCNHEMTYEKWDRGFREDFDGYVRNILSLKLED